MKPEQKARHQIDQLLESADWLVQDVQELNLGASLGVAVREFPLKSGPTDYLLFVDRKALGVIEAKPQGTTLSGVGEQSQAYLDGIADNIPYVQIPLPFAYETTGIETFFRDLRIWILALEEFLHFISLKLYMNGYLKATPLEQD
jgi:type I restriction enzyme R subunit